MTRIFTIIASTSSLGRIPRISLLIFVSLSLGCGKNELDEGGEARRYGTSGDATPVVPPALRTAKRSPEESSKMPPKFPVPSKEHDHKAAEYEDLVMNHSELLLDKIKSMGPGRDRERYLSAVLMRLTMYSDSDPEIASTYLEMVDRNVILYVGDRYLIDGIKFLAEQLGYQRSVELYDRLSSPQIRQLIAEGIGVSLAERKVVPSEQNLNHFDKEARDHLLNALRGKIRFESADELALFVETYEGKGELYRPLVDGDIGNMTRLESEDLIYSALRLSNPAAAEKVFGYGITAIPQRWRDGS
jgi:hypothetical protein